MPLSTSRGWVERINADGGIDVRGTVTTTSGDTPAGEEFWATIERKTIPDEEFAKIRPGSFWVLKVRESRKRPGVATKVTFKVIEKFWTKNELKQVRKRARKLGELFGTEPSEG